MMKHSGLAMKLSVIALVLMLAMAFAVPAMAESPCDCPSGFQTAPTDGPTASLRLALTPKQDTNSVGETHTLTAKLEVSYDGGNTWGPITNIAIDFEVTSGPNAGASGTAVTDANGEAKWSYEGTGGPGVDTIKATCECGCVTLDDTAEKTWIQETSVPSLTQWGIFGMISVMTVAAVFMLRRKYARKVE